DQPGDEAAAGEGIGWAGLFAYGKAERGTPIVVPAAGEFGDRAAGAGRGAELDFPVAAAGRGRGPGLAGKGNCGATRYSDSDRDYVRRVWHSPRGLWPAEQSGDLREIARR